MEIGLVLIRARNAEQRFRLSLRIAHDLSKFRAIREKKEKKEPESFAPGLCRTWTDAGCTAKSIPDAV
jgi:hypothetical protein